MTSSASTTATLDYEVRGTGDPILFIAGAADDRNGWAMNVPAFESEYRCVVFDNRDVGSSPRADAQYTIRDMAGDTLAVMDRAGIERAHVVGHSMGGMIAQHVAANAPERVRSLSLVCTMAGPDEYCNGVLNAWKIGAAQLSPEDFTRMALLFWVGETTINAAGVEALASEFVPAVAAQGFEAFIRQVTALQLSDLRSSLGGITAPTLVVGAAEDKCTPEHLSLELVRGIKGARYLRIEGSGHSPTVEQPEALNAAIREFLTTV
jgi:pimeloyl-ACP methyl ester carboxylesterase